MYRRIVVPLDGSELAEQALPEAEQLARLIEAPMHLIRVVDPTQLPWYGMFAANMDYATVQGVLGDGTKQADSYLSAIAQQTEERGLAVDHEVRQGRSSRELVASVKVGDLIVMASHGRGGITRWLLGSVAEDLLRHAPVPVLLVKASNTALVSGAESAPEDSLATATSAETETVGTRT